jgi:hypothetical protein
MIGAKGSGFSAVIPAEICRVGNGGFAVVHAGN